MKRRAAMLVVGALVLFFGAFAFYSHKFPQPVRAALDGLRLALILGSWPGKYEACYAKGFDGDACERWRIQPWTLEGEHWPYHDRSPMRWPEEPKERTYRAGMTPFEYFKALCEKESGEFITRTVKAESIYMIRPRKEIWERVTNYQIEDPYGHGQGDVGMDAGWNLIITDTQSGPDDTIPDYIFVEAPVFGEDSRPHRSLDRSYHPDFIKPPPKGARFTEFYYDLDAPTTWQTGFSVRYVDSLLSEYGYTWRGIRRPFDREMGISGGETAVVDLKTGEILGLRRGFQFRRAACPRYSMEGKVYFGSKVPLDKADGYTRLFLIRVVQPPFFLLSEAEDKALWDQIIRKDDATKRSVKRRWLTEHGLRWSYR